MSYGVILYFDEQTEKEFLKVWQSLADLNLSSHVLEAEIKPHITLAIYEELDCQPCENELVKITSKTSSLPVQFTHLGIFTNPEPVVFAAPLITRELLDFHNNLHIRLTNEGKKPWELYKPGRWVPHCTLALVEGHKARLQCGTHLLVKVPMVPLFVVWYANFYENQAVHG